MASSFANLVYVVTGAASGMGLATAKLLLDRGASLGLCDINQAALEQQFGSLSEEQKQRVIAESVSVVDEASISQFLAKTKERFGKVDGVANFAGTGGHALGKQLIWDMDEKEYDFIMDLNVRALYYILRAALRPGFLNEPGSIVHITSMYGERGFQNGAVFTASKHAANGMVKSAAMEAAERNIRVNAVMPCVFPLPTGWFPSQSLIASNSGVIDTPMHRAGRTEVPRPAVPMGRLGLSEEVASVTAFLLSGEASYVTGAQFAVDGGANAAGRHQ